MRFPGLVPLLLVAGCSDAPAPGAGPAPAPSAPAPPAGAPSDRLTGDSTSPQVPTADSEPALDPDPVRRRTAIEQSWFRTNFAEPGEPMRFLDLRPFLVAIRSATGAAAVDGAEEQWTAWLPRAVDATRALCREVAAVEPPPLESLGDERLRWLVFDDERDFTRWHERMGRLAYGNCYREVGGNGLVVATRAHLDRRAVTRLAAGQALARWRRHFCQLDDDAEADRRGESRETVLPDDRRLSPAYAWFERGLLSRVHAETCPEGAAEEDAWIRATLREAREKQRLWPLEDFLLADRPQVQSRARQCEGGNRADRTTQIHDAQSRLLFDVLLEGEGGRWREGMAALMRQTFRGISGTVYLKKAFGLPDGQDAPEFRRWIAEVEKACLTRLDAIAPR